ncbi:uncharacterized protein SPAPADRAFT_142882 [Spathaspora passalidarum NRRL Y-27907]|uniref:Thioredoxin-like fold domain-containing protein n=1 Tax=Spathaspora passalidarum (strain NRRL Y-27907 / 11-Y1) TaxID=619300 RepID=G3AT25_SPAPN|nr:uncharacterized protein SPAPADRAFT_142882 [Spathaspora passalidarum NRRL Y-27907]EGW30788.1 hypothetical protein SPAPADRAFT_142882 [Spathaspora passalidarum NRRL Y-27907]
MISPKYSLTHYYLSAKTLAASQGVSPHIINLYLDYNCPFSAKLYLKLYNKVIPELQAKHPGKFQFVYVNVIQPWHTNSNLLNEFAIAYAKLLREQPSGDTNGDFWKLSEVLFKNKESFYDTSNIDLTRNQIYAQIYDVVSKELKLAFDKKTILSQLEIPHSETPSNAGNATAVDVKYFTRYLRGVGVHITPTVSINGIVNDAISSGTPEEELIELFEKSL